MGNPNRGIDRARRVLSGANLGATLSSSGANRDEKYSNRELRYPTWVYVLSIKIYNRIIRMIFIFYRNLCYQIVLYLGRNLDPASFSHVHPLVERASLHFYYS